MILLQVTIAMNPCLYLLLVMVIISPLNKPHSTLKSVSELDRNFGEMMKTLFACLSPSPPMQWLPSFAVAQVRGAGPTQPAAGRGQQEVGREI